MGTTEAHGKGAKNGGYRTSFVTLARETLPKVFTILAKDYKTRFFMDELTRKKLLMARQLLKQNAPVIYQLFVANKHIKNRGAETHQVAIPSAIQHATDRQEIINN